MEAMMRKLALSIAAAAALLTAAAAPAMAQGFYVGPGGFGLSFGAPYYGYPGYYDYYGGPGVVVAPGWGWRHRYYRHHWRY
jgi:Spy/CpxP family protein refolding chaperone